MMNNSVGTVYYGSGGIGIDWFLQLLSMFATLVMFIACVYAIWWFLKYLISEGVKEGLAKYEAERGDDD